MLKKYYCLIVFVLWRYAVCGDTIRGNVNTLNGKQYWLEFQPNEIQRTNEGIEIITHKAIYDKVSKIIQNPGTQFPPGAALTLVHAGKKYALTKTEGGYFSVSQLKLSTQWGVILLPENYNPNQNNNELENPIINNKSNIIYYILVGGSILLIGGRFGYNYLLKNKKEKKQ